MQKLLTLGGIVALATVATAQSVVIPNGMATSHAGNTSLTWRRTQFHFQMFYDPSHFLDQGIDYPITITRMQYRAINGATSPGGEVFTGVTAMMSSSPSSWSAPDTTFANNRGADNTTVFTGDVTCLAATGGAPNTYIIDVPLQTNFVYDPTAGLDLCIEVLAPNAPVPNTNPNMAASSNSTHMARRLSTSDPNSPTGGTSYFASVVMLDYIPPPNLALATPYGEGCNDISVSWYETFGFDGFDLRFSTLRMTPTGTGYTVAPVADSWFTPTSPDLALTDDSLSSAQALGFTLPFPGGSTNDISICSNGFIWLDTTQTAATFSGTPALLLGQGPRLAPLWHDMNPENGGTIHFDLDPAGGVAYATWDRVPLFNDSTLLNTLQVAMYANGDIEYRYKRCRNDAGLFGWSPGGDANDPGSIDVSASMPFQTSADEFPLVLAATSRPRLNMTLDLEVRDLPANMNLLGINFGFLKIDPPIDLTAIGMPRCYEHATIDVAVSVTAVVPTSPYSIPVPNITSLVGVHMFLQGVGYSPGANALGVLTSNAVDLEFGIN